MNNDEALNQELTILADTLITEVTARPLSIREGVVLCMGPSPYRRLDCDGRALAYIRTRPRKGAVRIDISGLWIARAPSHLKVPSSGGSATLLIRSESDRREAAVFLESVVLDTRSQRPPPKERSGPRSPASLRRAA
jgi:hypothetical protein